MSKKNLFNNPALKQKQSSKTAFNLVHQTTNFNSVFDIKPLEKNEELEIEELLKIGSDPKKISDKQVSEDTRSIQTLTAEIKSIGKQAVVLMGERVYQAKTILKPYHDGTFTKWIETTFGSRKTGYNLLSYYEFYVSLPSSHLKEKFRKIPQTAAYILASRSGDMSCKEEIVKSYHNQKHDEIIALIQEKLPLQEKDKRTKKTEYSRRLVSTKNELKKIAQRRFSLSEDDREVLEEMQHLIDKIFRANAKRKRKK